jgi:hypothetical protein
VSKIKQDEMRCFVEKDEKVGSKRAIVMRCFKAYGLV